MADLDISSNKGVVDKRFGRGGNMPFTEKANMYDVASMRARLTGLNSTKYPTSKTLTMTKNDLLYALRVEGDSAGI